MDELEKKIQQEISEQDMLSQEENDLDFLNLDDIMKEFAQEEEDQEKTLPDADFAESILRTFSDDTVPEEASGQEDVQEDMGTTIRFEPIENDLLKAAPVSDQTQTIPSLTEEKEAFEGSWQPEFEQPIGEYVPPQPIIFHPRFQLRELKRKLVAGPERRYYELNELGVGKLQVAIFLSVIVVLLSAGATAFYAIGTCPPERLKLMVFGQFLAMMISALLGSYQLLEGLGDLFRGRFSFNTMLVFTLIACVADGVFCLESQRVPCCAAFSLQVTMSLIGAYHRRNTEMAMMDTLRKANHLHGIVREEDYFDQSDGLLRGKGRLEDFMENYNRPSKPEKVFSWYAVIALLASICIGVLGGIRHNSIPFGVQVTAVSLLAAVPVTAFISLSRPMAILEHRLHRWGAVLCGWQGVAGMSGRVVFPVGHEDLFPVGACKLNGVKFYGSRDPDEVVAYCNALVEVDGGGLAPLFAYLLASRNGRHYQVENLRAYADGGVGGEVRGEPVLMGNLAFLKSMGVEIPEGISVDQAVYAAIDGELCGVFAVTYGKIKSSSAGLRTLCAYRTLRPVLTTCDFMLTESFIRNRFYVNARRICFPEREVREELAAKQANDEKSSLALVTTEGLAPFGYAVTGARSLRTACWLGVAIHLLGGILGLLMMLVLAYIGADHLLTPANLFLYELVWLVPGWLITEWTRSI